MGEKRAQQRRNFLRKNTQDLTKGSGGDGDGAPEKKAKGKEPKVKVSEAEREALSRKILAGEGSVRSRPNRESLHKGSHQKLLEDAHNHLHHTSEPYPRPATQAVLAKTKSKAVRPRPKARDARQMAQYAEPSPPTTPERTMLQHAWHIVMTTDPLMDSDEENADEHVRLDYVRRLQTLNRLRGKSPTPEPLNSRPMEVDSAANNWPT